MSGPYLLMDRLGWRGAALNQGAFMVLARYIGGALGRDIAAAAVRLCEDQRR